MSKSAELKAELKAAELEDEFLEAKEANLKGKLDDDKYRAIKQKFHDARQAHRLERQQGTAGDGTVTPITGRASARPTDGGN